MSVNKWRRLSRIDVQDGVERKGNLDYLSWSYAWSQLMDVYPQAQYEWLEPVTFPDGSVMVKTSVSIDDDNYVMQLPVMDHRNKAIQGPDARQVSDAYMRCLVKNIAMHGIGIQLYLGDMKGAVQVTGMERAQQLMADGDFIEFHKLVRNLGEKDRVELFNGAEQGKKTEFKKVWRTLLHQAESFFTELTDTVEQAIASEDCLLLEESLEECSPYERSVLWARLNDDQKDAIKVMRSKA